MARLKKSFDAIAAAAESEEYRRLQEAEEWKAKKHKALNFQARLLDKPESEIEKIKSLLKAIDELFESEEKVYRTKRKRKETVTEEEEKQFKIEQEEEDEFYQTAL
jgi:HD superfamily phosphodiesterase